MVMLRVFSAFALPDTALTVKVEVPDAVGVPEMFPVEEFRVSPAGSAPELTDHTAPEMFAARAAV